MSTWLLKLEILTYIYACQWLHVTEDAILQTVRIDQKSISRYGRIIVTLHVPDVLLNLSQAAYPLLSKSTEIRISTVHVWAPNFATHKSASTLTS